MVSIITELMIIYLFVTMFYLNFIFLIFWAEVSTEEEGSCGSGGGSCSRLGEDLLRMFLDEISPDVTVEVGGRRIKAHKCILSSRCQYFAGMLSGGWVESAGNVISLQGWEHSSKMVVDYLFKWLLVFDGYWRFFFFKTIVPFVYLTKYILFIVSLPAVFVQFLINTGSSVTL